MINFEIDENEIKKIEKKLGNLSSKAPVVIKNAVNETAKKAREQLAKKAQEKYEIKKSKFNKSMKIKNATVSNNTAIISATGEVLELLDYKASPSKYSKTQRRNAVKGKVYKNGSLKLLQKGDLKAFIVRFRNGHISVVQRVEKGKEPSKSKLGNRYIKKILSPSIPKILGNETKVFGLVQPQIHSELKNNLSKHVEKMLRG